MTSIVSSSSSSNNYYVYQEPLPQTDLISRNGPFSNTYQTEPTPQDLTSFSRINKADTSDKHFLFSVHPLVRSLYLASAKKGIATHKLELINATLQGEEDRLMSEGLEINIEKNPDKYAEIFASRNWVHPTVHVPDLDEYKQHMAEIFMRLESHRHMIDTIQKEDSKLESIYSSNSGLHMRMKKRMKRINRTKAEEIKNKRIEMYKKGIDSEKSQCHRVSTNTLISQNSGVLEDKVRLALSRQKKKETNY